MDEWLLAPKAFLGVWISGAMEYSGANPSQT